MKNVLKFCVPFFVVCLSLLMSCGSDDDGGDAVVGNTVVENKLFSEDFTTTANLEVEMTWTVGDSVDGYKYIDLDLLIDDVDQGTSYEVSSGSGYSTEDLTFFSSKADGSYYFSVYVFHYESLKDGIVVTDEEVEYAIKVYPVGDESSAISFTGIVKNSHYDEDSDDSYAYYRLDKLGDDYTVVELDTVKVIENGY